MSGPLRPQTRQFLKTATAGAAWLALAPAQAQGGPKEGVEYRVVQPTQQTDSGAKLEVLEFFWYGCPHCNAFEPLLDAWVRKLPPDVDFKRVPVVFRENYTVHQRTYYALEAMGQVEALHRKIFYAIHNDRQRLDKLAEVAAFVAKNGVDGAKFTEFYNSFAVQTKARQANQLAEAYKIDGVPALGVQGRWFTSGTLAGGNERMLAVVDHLIQRSRKAG